MELTEITEYLSNKKISMLQESSLNFLKQQYEEALSLLEKIKSSQILISDKRIIEGFIEYTLTENIPEKILE